MARRLVIIGGDAAGMSAAAQARRMTSAGELEIVAFERGSRTSYAACGLPYLVGGLVDRPELLIARTPEQHRANGIEVRIHHEVTAIDVKALTVTVRDLDTGRRTFRRTPHWHRRIGHRPSVARHRRGGGAAAPDPRRRGGSGTTT